MLRITITHEDTGTWCTYNTKSDNEDAAVAKAKADFYKDFCRGNITDELSFKIKKVDK